jgi:DNA polymerase I-like protein with 3'-5' exonuclease and polymerase domains
MPFMSMMAAADLRVPLELDAGSGPNWDEALMEQQSPG